MLALGDLSAARLLFGRAAASGSGAAMLAMARTYDPDFRTGPGPQTSVNKAMADEWYRRAEGAGLGNPASSEPIASPELALSASAASPRTPMPPRSELLTAAPPPVAGNTPTSSVPHPQAAVGSEQGPSRAPDSTETVGGAGTDTRVIVHSAGAADRTLLANTLAGKIGLARGQLAVDEVGQAGSSATIRLFRAGDHQLARRLGDEFTAMGIAWRIENLANRTSDGFERPVEVWLPSRMSIRALSSPRTTN